MNNYRPVSILPVISKALEKVVQSRFTEFEQKYKLLTPSQFGFHKGCGTEFALLTQKELILAALEEGKLVLAIIEYISWITSNAFDHLNHTLLIQKLQSYGFQENAVSLILATL